MSWRGWKTARRWFAYVFLFAVVLIGIVAMLLNTESGSRFVLNRVAAAVPGSLYLDEINGTLWRSLSVRVVRYRNDSVDVGADNLRLEIHWPRILAGQPALSRFEVDAVEVQSLVVASEPAEPAPFTLDMPELPVRIAVDNLRVGRFSLHRQADTIAADRFQADRLTFSGNRMAADRLSATAFETYASFTDIEATLSGEVPLEAKLSWQRAIDNLSGRGEVSGSLAALAINHTLEAPYAIETTGSLRLVGRLIPAFELQFAWDEVPVAPVILSDGVLDIRGTTDDYESEFTVTVSEPRVPDVRVGGSASGDTRTLRALNIRLESDDIEGTIAGDLRWSPGLAANLEIDVNGFDPALIRPALMGSLDGNARLSMPAQDDWRLEILSVGGNINDAPVAASGILTYTPLAQRCEGCSVRFGDNLIDFDGGLGENQLNVTISIEAAMLGEIDDRIAGRLTADGVVSGSIQDPVYTGSMDATGLEFRDFYVGTLEIDSLGTGATVFDLAASATGLRRGKSDFGTLNTRLVGNLERFDIDADWAYQDRMTASAAARLGWRDGTLAGEIRRAAMDEHYTGRWVLGAPMTVDIGPGMFETGPQRWLLPDGIVDITRLRIAPNDTSIAGSITGLPLATANIMLPDSLRLEGTAGGEFDLTRRDVSWNGRASWRQSDTVVTIREEDLEPYRLAVPVAAIEAGFASGGATIESEIRIEPGVSLTAATTISSLADDPQIDGRLRIEGESWDWINSLFAEIDNFEGDVSADLRFSGALANPDIAGEASWQDGGIAIPTLNVPLTEVDLVVTGTRGGSATIRGSALAGGGTLAVDGSIEDAFRDSRRVELTLTGSAAQIINWPEYNIRVSPDMELVGSFGGWDAQGSVTVPAANIVVRELPENAVTVSPDIRTTEQDFSTARAAARFSAETVVTLGEDVHISAFGLDADLEGELVVRKSPDQEPRGEGRVTLRDGVFVAYGQRLSIEEGTLTFTGPLDDPIVDVRAVRRIETFDTTVLAGIHLTGRARSLTASVYSEPAMAEADALSYLVLGRPLSEATESEGGELSTAAVGLGLRQASRITQQLGQQVGLDQLAIVGDGGDATALVAGKQINERLYARYAYGVFSRLGMILIRYRLTERLSLEAGAGETQSIDLLYTVEKE